MKLREPKPFAEGHTACQSQSKTAGPAPTGLQSLSSLHYTRGGSKVCLQHVSSPRTFLHPVPLSWMQGLHSVLLWGGACWWAVDRRGPVWKQRCERRGHAVMFRVPWYSGVREILFGSDPKEPFSLRQASLLLLSGHNGLSQGFTASPVRGVESEHTVGSKMPKKNVVLSPRNSCPSSPKGHQKIRPWGKRREQNQGAVSFPAMGGNTIKTPFMEPQ